jgi:hypothetical protein
MKFYRICGLSLIGQQKGKWGRVSEINSLWTETLESFEDFKGWVPNEPSPSKWMRFVYDAQIKNVMQAMIIDNVQSDVNYSFINYVLSCSNDDYIVQLKLKANYDRFDIIPLTADEIIEWDNNWTMKE